MKIGVVSDFYFPWIGGPVSVIHNLAHGLAARGHSLFLLMPSSNGEPSTEEDGPLHIYRARTVPVPFGYNVRVCYRPRNDASRWLDEVQPDILHFHHPFPLSVAAASLARSRAIPTVATNHTIPECSLWGMRRLGPLYDATSWIFKRWLLHVLARADSVVTPTKTAARLLAELGYVRPVIAISNGIDTCRFSPGPPNEELRNRLGLDARPIVLYTGRLDAEKQMDVWLRAAAILAQKQDVQFVVGGKGTDEATSRRLARDLGLEARIRFVGYLSDDDFPDIYRLAAAYFITSPVELQSIATLEAAASGLPLVAVASGALPELVQEGDNGFLVPPGCHDLAADRLARIMSDEGLRRDLAASSRRIAVGHDLLRSVDAYEGWLTTILSERRGERQVERVLVGEP